MTLIPEAMCVLANNRQLDDMKKFLIEEGNSVIKGVDCTFNLGSFLATVTTYRHPMLHDCESRRSAVMMGPILLHVKRTVQSYAYLGEVLASICPELANIKWIGTDRERAIFEGLKKSMPVSKNILCTKHVKDNIERKLTEMGVGQKAKSEFCRDIFGGREERQGLIHATTAELFDEQLALFEKE